jgi:hypothetical protein
MMVAEGESGKASNGVAPIPQSTLRVAHADQRARLFGCRFGRGVEAERRGQEAAENHKEARRLAAEESALIEARNDELVEQLSGKVEILRDVALQVDQEVTVSNNLLDQMGQNFDAAQSLLKKTHERLQQMTKDPGCMNLVRMTFFCVFLVILLYFLSLRWRAVASGAKAVGNAASGTVRFLSPSRVIIANTTSAGQPAM